MHSRLWGLGRAPAGPAHAFSSRHCRTPSFLCPVLGFGGKGKSSGSLDFPLGSFKELPPLASFLCSLGAWALRRVKIPKSLRDGSPGVCAGCFLGPQRFGVRDPDRKGVCARARARVRSPWGWGARTPASAQTPADAPGGRRPGPRSPQGPLPVRARSEAPARRTTARAVRAGTPGERRGSHELPWECEAGRLLPPRARGRPGLPSPDNGRPCGGSPFRLLEPLLPLPRLRSAAAKLGGGVCALREESPSRRRRPEASAPEPQTRSEFPGSGRARSGLWRLGPHGRARAGRPRRRGGGAERGGRRDPSPDAGRAWAVRSRAPA